MAHLMMVPIRWRTLRGSRVLVRPDGQQHGHDVGRGHLSDPLVADAREGVIAEGRQPLTGGSGGVLPRLAVDRDHLVGRLPEGRHAVGSALGRERIAARAGDPAIVEGQLTGLGQWHEVEAAEAERSGTCLG